MTRKDYVKIAEAFRSTEPTFEDSPEYNVWRKVLDAVADTLAEDNPRFDRMRFTFAASN
jgi:hypothetical protein